MITPNDRRELMEKLQTLREALFQQVESLPRERLTAAWKEGDRTPMGMLLHIINAERSYRENWARRAREEDAPDVRASDVAQPPPAVPGARGGGAPLFEEANQMSKEELIALLRDERVKTLCFLAETADAELERVARNTPFGDLTVHQLMKSLYRHDQMHIDEMAGRPSRYVVTTQEGRRL